MRMKTSWYNEKPKLPTMDEVRLIAFLCFLLGFFGGLALAMACVLATR